MFLALPAELTAKTAPILRPPMATDADTFRAILASLMSATAEAVPEGDVVIPVEQQDIDVGQSPELVQVVVADDPAELVPQVDAINVTDTIAVGPPVPPAPEVIADNAEVSEDAPVGASVVAHQSTGVAAPLSEPTLARDPVTRPADAQDSAKAVAPVAGAAPAITAAEPVVNAGLATLAQLPDPVEPVQQAAVAVIANPRAALWQGRLSLGAMHEGSKNAKPDVQQLPVEGAATEVKPVFDRAAPTLGVERSNVVPRGNLPVFNAQDLPPPMEPDRVPTPEAPVAPRLANSPDAALMQASKPDQPGPDLAQAPRAAPAAQPAPTMPPATAIIMPTAPVMAKAVAVEAIKVESVVEAAPAGVIATEGRAAVPPGFAALQVAPVTIESVTPTAPAAPHKGVDVAQSIAQQIGTQITASTSGGFEVALAPDELGAVRLRLHSTEAGSVLIVQAERPETMDLMRRHITTLEHDLRALGHDALTVRFAGNAAGGGFGNAPNGGAAGHPGQTADPDQTTGAEPAAQTPPSPQKVGADDHLDLRL